MKKLYFLFLAILSPILLLGQDLDVEGDSHISGQLGIGTNIPAAKLSIVGLRTDPLIPGSTSNGLLRIGPSANLTEGLDIGKKNMGTYDAWLQAGFNGTADPISLQPLGGNVGIGILSPNELLHVNGNVRVAGTISGVTDPVSAQDAATKKYVDDNTGGGSGNTSQLIIKPSDQTVGNTTIANDNDFIFALDANSTYHFEAVMVFEGGANEAQAEWSYTGTMDIVNYFIHTGSTGITTLGNTGSINVNSSPRGEDWRGIFKTTTAGTLTFRFARFEDDDAVGCTLKANSFMLFTKLN